MHNRYTAPALAALLVAGCGSPRNPESSPSASPTIQVTLAHAAATERRARVEAGGIVQASATAHITSRIVAPILAVHVREGEHVRPGQTLVTLDARELTAQAERANATVLSAVEAARASEARAASATASGQLAAATHARIKGLFDKRSATPQEFDQAVAALDAANANLANARAESAAAVAARDAAQAAADATTVSRSYAELTAPFDGLVTARRADPGSLASPGLPLVTIDESGPVRLEVRVDESRAARIHAGDLAEVRLDGDGRGTWISATVREVGRADPAAHSVLIKLQLPPGTTARSGSFGRARLAGDARRTLVVPNSSVVSRAGLTFVFAVDAESRARLRPVVTGAVDGERTEILAGVVDGDTVIVSPPVELLDGSRVSAQESRR